MMIHTARVFDNRDTKEVRLPLPPFCRSDECIYLYILDMPIDFTFFFL